MARNDPMIHVRVPPELKEKLQKSAEMNRRSVNSEIILRLEESYKKKSG